MIMDLQVKTKRVGTSTIETTITGLEEADEVLLDRMITQFSSLCSLYPKEKQTWIISAPTIKGYTIAALELANKKFKELKENGSLDKIIVKTNSTMIRMGIALVRLAANIDIKAEKNF